MIAEAPTLPPMDRSKWKRVRFGDVVRCVDKTCRNPQAEGLDRVVGLEHLDPGELKITRWADLADGTSFTRTFKAGQVLFGKRRAYQRKAAVAEFDGICSGDILVFEASSDELDPELLPFIVHTNRFWENAVATSAGSLSPRTKWKDLATFEFALPPLEEQHRFSKLLASARHTDAGFLIAQQYAMEAYRARIKKLLIPTAQSAVMPVAEFGSVQLGRQRAPKYQTGHFTRRYLRVANVFDGFFDLGDVLSMDFDASDFERFRLEEGDILLNEGQSRELVGRCAIWRGEIDPCCFQNTLIRFRSGTMVVPMYAFHLFRAAYYAGIFASVSKQTTSIAHLGAERFASLTFPLPGLDEQRRALEEIEALSSIVESISKHRMACSQLGSQIADRLVRVEEYV